MSVILSVNCVVPPDRYGGAEKSALDLAKGFADVGHEVHFLGAQTDATKARSDYILDGLNIHTRLFRRPYPLHSNQKHGTWQKFLWHASDLLAPSNEDTFEVVLNGVRPEVVIVHNAQGVGFNIFRVLGRHNIPVLHVLHDLGIACLNRSMFRNGKHCAGQCIACRVSTIARMKMLRTIRNLVLVSPSNANLEKLRQFVNFAGIRTEIIPNPNAYPIFARRMADGGPLRLLYVGRLSPEKGVEFVIQVLNRIGSKLNYVLEVLGDGPDRGKLEKLASKNSGIRFHGHVNLSQVGQAMADSDILLVPSLWDENFPGVIVHALQSGLPVFASNSGGNRELVEDRSNGRLLSAGDTRAWSVALAQLGADRRELDLMSVRATLSGAKYEPRRLIGCYDKLVQGA